MVDRYEGAGGGTAGEVRIEVDGFEIDSLRAEIKRLQDAKRRALDIADERGKEVVALRADNKWLVERLRDAVNVCYGGVSHDEIDSHEQKGGADEQA